MLSFKKISIAISMLMLVGSAYAAIQPTGVYIGANGSYESIDNGTTTNDASGQSVFGYGATLGYQYAFTQNFALGAEFNYQYFGKNTDNTQTTFSLINTSYENEGYQILAVASYMWSNGINLFGKIGTAGIDTTVNVMGMSANTTTWLPAAAIGVGYMPVQNLNVYLQYEYINGDDYDNVTISGNSIGLPGEAMTQKVLSLGLTYTFPM